MKTSFFLLSIPAVMAASIIAVVACSPRSSGVPVQIAPRSPLTQAIDDCTRTVRDGKLVVVQGRTTKVCMVPDEIDESDIGLDPHSTPPVPVLSLEAGDGVAPTIEHQEIKSATDAEAAVETAGELTAQAKPGYKIVDRPVRYAVSNNLGHLKVSLNIGVSLPEALSKAERPVRQDIYGRISDVLYNKCLQQVKGVWARSGVELEVKFNEIKPDDKTDYHQRIRLVSEKPLEKFSRFSVSSWPDRGDLRPFGDKDLSSACARAKSAEEQKACLSEALFKANDDFCLNVAMMIGYWTGLEGDALAAKSCASEKKLDVHASYMKTGSDETDRKSFWNNAKLSGADLKTVFQPVCPGVLKRESVTDQASLALAH